MSKFEIRGNKYFRLSRENGKTINNNIMTDELALEFLKINPERINLFSKFPKNWEEMLGIDNSEAVEEVEDTVEPVQETDPVSYTEEEKKEQLRKYKLRELRTMYPDVKEEFGGTKEDFITQIINSIA